MPHNTGRCSDSLGFRTRYGAGVSISSVATALVSSRLAEIVANARRIALAAQMAGVDEADWL